MVLIGEYKEKIDIDNVSDRSKRIFLAEIILNYIAWTAQIGVIGTMMIMFIKHSKTISKAK